MGLLDEVYEENKNVQIFDNKEQVETKSELEKNCDATIKLILKELPGLYEVYRKQGRTLYKLASSKNSIPYVKLQMFEKNGYVIPIKKDAYTKSVYVVTNKGNIYVCSVNKNANKVFNLRPTNKMTLVNPEDYKKSYNSNEELMYNVFKYSFYDNQDVKNGDVEKAAKDFLTFLVTKVVPDDCILKSRAYN